MKIFKIQIQNYRLLKDFSIDLEDELSLVIGKNNTGKTSILSALEKFLNQSERNKFSFDDFNIVFKNNLKTLATHATDLSENDYEPGLLGLRLFIEYDESDNLSNISRVMMDLDPDNNSSKYWDLRYSLGYLEYLTLKAADFEQFASKRGHKQSASPNYQMLGVFDFLKVNHSKYFHFERKSYEYTHATGILNLFNFVDLDKEGISLKDIINFKYIPAKRDVTNKEFDKTLSGQTSKIYKQTEFNDEQTQAVEDFKDTLSNTDIS